LWRDPHAQAFLGRYLMPLAAILSEWGATADRRHRLLDPRIAPAEALGWLGGLVGLAMDPCWPEAARRRMVQAASALFRIRGTVPGLRRMIEILTGAQVIIVEKFRLRAGGVVGNAEATRSRSVLGAGFRVGGAVGKDEETLLRPGVDLHFDDFAHRFSVMLVARLSDEQLRCLSRLIETHKPAHTMFDLCTIEAGTRVGVGLHVGLASAIGRSSGFDPLTLGDSVLGKGYVLGRPELDRPAAGSTGGWRSGCDDGVVA
jgi:phage tail-like protein